MRDPGVRPRPAWWPDNEPWPPARSAWHGRRQDFFIRLIIGFAITFMIGVCVCTVALNLIAGALSNFNLPFDRVLAALPVLLLIIFVATRGLRRVARPIGDLLDAADRIAEGDYAVRVTERGPREVRALAQAFNAMAARLKQQDEQRRNLLADVAHEVRTPLTVVQGNLEGLLDGVYPRDDARLELILEETRLLSRLLDDLRMLALAESGALQLQKEPTDLTALVNETVAAFRAQADAAGVTLRAETGSDVPALMVDPARLREVLANLIVNALRYTPSGGQVRVTCAVNDGEHVRLAVADNGSGIAPDDLAHIFDRFYKTSDSRGSGLGLAIAKNLVEAHGGEMHAESEVGRGTTIGLTLPLRV